MAVHVNAHTNLVDNVALPKVHASFVVVAIGPVARLGRGTAAAYELTREHVPFRAQDAVMCPNVEAVRELIASGALIGAVRLALPEAFEQAGL